MAIVRVTYGFIVYAIVWLMFMSLYGLYIFLQYGFLCLLCRMYFDAVLLAFIACMMS